MIMLTIKTSDSTIIYFLFFVFVYFLFVGKHHNKKGNFSTVVIGGLPSCGWWKWASWGTT